MDSPIASHQYEVCRPELFRAIGGPLLAVVAVGGLVHLAGILGLLPSPKPMLDVDRTVIVRQADSSREGQPASTILLGDSSCLMDVDTPLLAELQGEDVLNLGTLSFLNLASFGKLLQNQLTNGAASPERVVLLVHPDFVRKNSSSPAHVAALEHYLAGTDQFYGIGGPFNLRKALGVHLIEGRLVARIPRPLFGDFGRQYGFTSRVYDYMLRNRGSALDPRTLDPEKLTGSSDYRVASAHKKGAPDFGSVVPEGIKLYVGLTPLPESFPTDRYPEDFRKLATELAGLFPGAVPLVDLPPTLPDDQFANKTHLRPEARASFTGRLHEVLKSVTEDFSGTL